MEILSLLFGVIGEEREYVLFSDLSICNVNIFYGIKERVTDLISLFVLQAT